MGAFIRFNRGVLRLPLPVSLWMLLVVAANMMAPLFFLHRLEAQVILASFAASIILMITVSAVWGFCRLMGIGHVPLLPMLVFLGARLGDIPASDPFGVWVRVVIVLDLVALVFDAVDVIRYIKGAREPIVQGL